jgi:hypothetical protein
MPRGIYKRKPDIKYGATGKHWKCKHLRSLKQRKNMSKARMGNHTSRNKGRRYYGSENPCWRGGISREKRYLNPEYKEWQLMVFGRDNFTCQICKRRGGYLDAHHILPWAIYPEYRYDINNGMTLCKECHNKTKGRR